MSDTDTDIRHEEIPAVISKFRARWPDAFCWPPRPLALYIFDDIFAAMFPRDAADPNWRAYPSARKISATLGWWCSQVEYLRACTRDADRYDLHGRPCGKVDVLAAKYAVEEAARRSPPRTALPLPQVPPEPLTYLVSADHPYLRTMQPRIFQNRDGKFYVKFRDFFGSKSESADFDTEAEATTFAEGLQRDRRIRVHDHEDFDAAEARWREFAAAEKTAAEKIAKRKLKAKG